jgi:transcriptional regulator of acetoin/glycerol metabolism
VRDPAPPADTLGESDLSRALEPGPALPPQPFFSTPQQRLALARERYFEQGIRPSGLVSESVIQSWSRCLQARRDPREAIAFNPVTASRVQSALTRSRLLLETAAHDLKQLESVLAGTACTVLLTDPQGVVVHAAWAGQSHDEVLLPLARRIGVCLAEDSIGTNAPGVTARTGQASLVLGGEHFFGCVQVMHCAAAPMIAPGTVDSCWHASPRSF